MQPGEIGRAAIRDDRPALTSVRNQAQKELDQGLALHLGLLTWSISVPFVRGSAPLAPSPQQAWPPTRQDEYFYSR